MSGTSAWMTGFVMGAVVTAVIPASAAKKIRETENAVRRVEEKVNRLTETLASLSATVQRIDEDMTAVIEQTRDLDDLVLVRQTKDNT